jgi:hypothetical protein
MDRSVTRGCGTGVQYGEPVLELLVDVSFLKLVPRLVKLLLHPEELLGDLGDLLLSVHQIPIQGLPQLGISPEMVNLAYDVSVTYVSKAVVDCKLLATTSL